MITKEYFLFSWACDRWLVSEHVCGRAKPRGHYASCEQLLTYTTFERQAKSFQDRKQWVSASPFQQLPFG